jgi:hypothetical protein
MGAAPRQIISPARSGARNLVLAQRPQGPKQERELAAVAASLASVWARRGSEAVELGNAPIDQIKNGQAPDPPDSH